MRPASEADTSSAGAALQPTARTTVADAAAGPVRYWHRTQSEPWTRTHVGLECDSICVLAPADAASRRAPAPPASPGRPSCRAADSPPAKRGPTLRRGTGPNLSLPTGKGHI